ncbi:hypothetical protein [Mesorhizobium sp. A556]
MDEAAFLKNERPTEFEARFTVEGEVRVTIEAESLDEAKAKAAAMVEDEEFGLELDEVTDASIGSVWKSPTMFLVLRDGKTMQVSRLIEGDQPREFTETGF